MPLVSVILAFHRLTPHLQPAVRSILTQTLEDLELIVVDDGTGLGASALDDAAADPRLRLLTFSENRGIAAAHNAAVAVARGEFVAMMDYDDISLPHRLEKQVAALRAEPSLGMVFAAADTIDAVGRVTGREFAVVSPTEHAVFSAYAMPANSPTLMARREVFARFSHREDYRIAPDFDFYARAVEAWSSCTLPEIHFQYRRHQGQTTSGTPPLQILENSITRLLTARRRAGRAEEYEKLMSATAGMRARPPSPAEACAWLLARALEENLPLLAAHSARRLLGARRNLHGTGEALAAMTALLARAENCRGKALRLFFTGPLRTHGLRRC